MQPRDVAVSLISREAFCIWNLVVFEKDATHV